MRRIVDKLRSGVFGIVVICQFVSPIKLPSTYSAVMFGQFPAFESLMSAEISHPRVSFATLSTHVTLQGGTPASQAWFSRFRNQFDILGFKSSKLVHQFGTVWNTRNIDYCEFVVTY